MVVTSEKFFVFSFPFFAPQPKMFSDRQPFEKRSRSYQDLIVWEKSIDLAKEVYRYTQTFPKDETYGLRQQARRAAVSISANIAEGQARNGINEFIQFLGIANGSLAELKTHIFISERLGFGKPTDTKILLIHCDSVAQLLNGLRISLQKTKNEKQKTPFRPRG